MTKTFLKKLILFIFTLLFLTPFFSGGENFFVKTTAFILIDMAVIIFILGFKKPVFKNSKLISSPYLYLSLFSLGAILNIVYSIYPLGSLIQFFNYLNYFLLFFLASNLKLKSQDIKFILKSFLSVSIIICFTGFYFLLTGNYSRLTSTFYWPNPLAGFLLFPFFISLYFLKTEKNKLLNLTALAVIFSALILTGSRGAWLALILSSVFVFLWYFPKIKKNIDFKKIANYTFKVLILSALLIFILSYFKTTPLFFGDRQTETNNLDQSSNIRLEYYKAGWDLFKEKPLLGHGLDSFSKLYPKLQTSPINAGKYVHNWYLEILLETGVFMFILFLAFLFFSLFKQKPKFLSYKFFLTLALVAYLAHSFLDINNHYLANNIVFFLFLGLLNHNQKNNSSKNFLKILIILIALASIIFFSLQTHYFTKTDKSVSQGEIEINYDNWFYTSSNKHKLAYYYLHRQNYQETENIITSALKYDSSNYLNYEILGNTKLKQGEYDKAKKYYHQAIKLNPYIIRLHTQLAIAEIKQDNYGQAKKIVNKTLNIYSKEVLESTKLEIMKNQELFSNAEKEFKELKEIKKFLVEKTSQK